MSTYPEKRRAKDIPHDLWRDTDDGGNDEFAKDGETELLGDAPAGEDDTGGTVRYLRGVPGVRKAVLGEGGLELGERLLGDTRSDSIVRVDDNLLLLLGLGVSPADLRVSYSQAPDSTKASSP
jgi:hypothetical protein